jgi:hypothetical protein
MAARMERREIRSNRKTPGQKRSSICPRKIEDGRLGQISFDSFDFERAVRSKSRTRTASASAASKPPSATLPFLSLSLSLSLSLPHSLPISISFSSAVPTLGWTASTDFGRQQPLLRFELCIEKFYISFFAGRNKSPDFLNFLLRGRILLPSIKMRISCYLVFSLPGAKSICIFLKITLNLTIEICNYSLPHLNASIYTYNPTQNFAVSKRRALISII